MKVKCKEFLFYFVLITKIVNTVERIKKIFFSTLVYWKNISINPSPPNQRNQPFTYLSKGYGFMVLSSYTYMLVIPDCMLCANAGWSDPDLAKNCPDLIFGSGSGRKDPDPIFGSGPIKLVYT